MSRPTEVTPELGNTICERIALGESLRAICNEDAMPRKIIVLRHLAADEAFRTQYARAREDQADTIAEEILEIADDGTNDWMERRSESEKGAGIDTGWVINGEHVQRSRLRVDSRKWFAGKVAPKKYGEKLTQEHTGADGGPIAITGVQITIVDPKG